MAWKKSTGLESSRQFFAFAPFARSHAVSQDAFSYFLIVIHKGNCSKLLKVLEVTFFIKTQTNKKGKKSKKYYVAGAVCNKTQPTHLSDTKMGYQRYQSAKNWPEFSGDNFLLLLYHLTLNSTSKKWEIGIMSKSCFHPSNTYLDNFIVRNHLFIYKYIFR